MKWKFSQLPWKWIRLALGLAILAAAGLMYSSWWPPLSRWIDDTMAGSRGQAVTVEPNQTAPGSVASPAKTLDLSPQALRNLGLTSDFLRPIELTNYSRSITVPAVIVPKPGRSQIVVTSPLNGVITHVHAVTGEAVKPGELLFEVRLTYEDLVETQTQYLKSISELEVENREIIRLEQATQSGAISGKSLLERRYAREKLEALLKSQREGLRLHGLSDRQIDAIGTDGKLLRDLQIVAPEIDRHGDDEEMKLSQNLIHRVSFGGHGGMLQDNASPGATPETSPGKLLVIEDLRIHKGQAVVAGEKLCSLSDYSSLFIEGKAFEQNAAELSQATARGWKVDAVFPGHDGLKVLAGLKLAFVGNSIDADSRTLSFFVELPNEILRDETNSGGQRFVAWRYRLGQRLEIRIPVEQWENQIVVPVDAVVKDGADWFVFQQNGTKFNRTPVHVLHRDQTSVVIANDGSVFPGDVIAMKSAHLMQMAVRNQAGGAVDPHAGHSH